MPLTSTSPSIFRYPQFPNNIVGRNSPTDYVVGCSGDTVTEYNLNVINNNQESKPGKWDNFNTKEFAVTLVSPMSGVTQTPGTSVTTSPASATRTGTLKENLDGSLMDYFTIIPDDSADDFTFNSDFAIVIGSATIGTGSILKIEEQKMCCTIGTSVKTCTKYKPCFCKLQARPCINSDLTAANSASCKCGQSICNDESGLWCNSASSTCGKGPRCTNVNGLKPNKADCICGIGNIHGAPLSCVKGKNGLYCQQTNTVSCQNAPQDVDCGSSDWIKSGGYFNIKGSGCAIRGKEAVIQPTQTLSLTGDSSYPVIGSDGIRSGPYRLVRSFVRRRRRCCYCCYTTKWLTLILLLFLIFSFSRFLIFLFSFLLFVIVVSFLSLRLHLPPHCSLISSPEC